MYTIILTNWLENNGDFKFSRSGGPGGQNVNKVNTKVTLHLKIEDLDFLTENEINRVSSYLSNRTNKNNELVISCDEERTQSKNRAKLIYKTVMLIEKGLVVKKKRKATKPTKSSVARRIEAKKRLSLKKQCRNSKDFY